MFHKIQEICTKIGTRIFKIDQEMTEKIELKVGTPQKSEVENVPIWATPENLPFFKDENFPLFSYSYWSNVPKWKCAHILLCKKYKNCLKLLKIAYLQPPDWIQRKKNTLYNRFSNGGQKCVVHFSWTPRKKYLYRYCHSISTSRWSNFLIFLMFKILDICILFLRCLPGFVRLTLTITSMAESSRK